MEIKKAPGRGEDACGDEMQALERRFDDLFPWFRRRARTYFPALTSGLRKPFIPGCDVYRKDGEMVVQLELPGIDPSKDVHVTIEDGDLMIRGERKQREEIKEEDYHRMETSFGSFERCLPLPEDTTEKDIKAEYHDGLLDIHVPAGETGMPAPPTAKQIPIKTSGGKTKAA